MPALEERKQHFPCLVLLWRRLSLQVKWFAAAVVVVVALAVIFSEGLMASAGTKGDDWATKMVDSVVNNQTGVC
jgi:hypothetical protein